MSAQVFGFHSAPTRFPSAHNGPDWTQSSSVSRDWLGRICPDKWATVQTVANCLTHPVRAQSLYPNNVALKSGHPLSQPGFNSILIRPLLGSKNGQLQPTHVAISLFQSDGCAGIVDRLQKETWLVEPEAFSESFSDILKSISGAPHTPEVSYPYETVSPQIARGQQCVFHLSEERLKTKSVLLDLIGVYKMVRPELRSWLSVGVGLHTLLPACHIQFEASELINYARPESIETTPSCPKMKYNASSLLQLSWSVKRQGWGIEVRKAMCTKIATFLPVLQSLDERDEQDIQSFLINGYTTPDVINRWCFSPSLRQAIRYRLKGLPDKSYDLMLCCLMETASRSLHWRTEHLARYDSLFDDGQLQALAPDNFRRLRKAFADAILKIAAQPENYRPQRALKLISNLWHFMESIAPSDSDRNTSLASRVRRTFGSETPAEIA